MQPGARVHSRQRARIVGGRSRRRGGRCFAVPIAKSNTGEGGSGEASSEVISTSATATRCSFFTAIGRCPLAPPADLSPPVRQC
jgi:hypothetical protein